MPAIFHFVVDSDWKQLTLDWCSDLLRLGLLLWLQHKTLLDRVGSFPFLGRGLFLRVDELALNCFHDVTLAALSPQEVDPVRLFFIVLQPPVPLLEQRPHEH